MEGGLAEPEIAGGVAEPEIAGAVHAEHNSDEDSLFSSSSEEDPMLGSTDTED